MSRWLCMVVLLLQLLPVRHVCAQELPMLHFTVADGLPSNNIYNIYRDSKGFLWFGSDKGLARYNGVKFEAFTTNNGMPDNEVFFTKEDLYGRLWLGTYNGELCFYKDGVFHIAANTTYLKMPVPSPHISNITLASDSSIVFNFYNDKYMAVVFRDKLKYYDFSKLLSEVNAKAMYKRKLPDGTFQVFRDGQILIVDTNYRVLSTKLWPEWTIKTVHIQSQNGEWLTNDVGVYNMDGKLIYRDRDTAKKPLTTYKVNDYYNDGYNSLSCGNEGLLINECVKLLPGHKVSSVTRDHDGNYWVSTLNNGVYVFHKDLLKTRIFRNVYADELKYSKVIDGRVFFVIADNSLNEFQNGTVKKLVDIYDVRNIDHASSKDGTSLIDVANSTYYCFMRFYIVVYNWKSRQTHIVPMALPFDGSKEVFRNGDHIYVKGRSNICKLGEDVLRATQPVAGQSMVKDRMSRIYGIAQAPDSSIWYSTATSMYTIANGNTVSDKRFDKYALKQMAFIDKYLVCYTHNNQLLVCDNLSGGQLHVDTVRGHDCVWDEFYPLDSAHLLISTNNLYRLLTINQPGSRQKFSVVPVENAFLPVQAESVCADSAAVYFFTGGTITVVPKQTILERPLQPRLFFTALKTSARIYRAPDIADNTLDIPYQESRSISLAFDKLLVKGQSVIQQYSVSKNGQDNWVSIDGDELTLVNPGYGDYIIKIRARTLAGTFGPPVVFSLHIRNPFWATGWFLVSIALIAVLLVVLLVRVRVRYIVLKNEKEYQNEMKFVKSEYKALNALMNPHFVFNTLNNVQGLVNRDDKLAANEYIRVFADLIRQNMHNLSKEMVTLQKEIELVVNYLLLEKLRFKDLLNYSIEVDDKIDLSEILVPPLLVQPLVENSIKHGILPLESVEGTVVIRIYEQDASLFIEVRDNGIGLAKAREYKSGSAHESFAMENIKKRIEQLAIILNKQITLEMKEEKLPGELRQWTVVTIAMPVV